MDELLGRNNAPMECEQTFRIILILGFTAEHLPGSSYTVEATDGRVVILALTLDLPSAY